MKKILYALIYMLVSIIPVQAGMSVTGLHFDSSGNLKVNMAVGNVVIQGLSGSNTPADSFANPTDAVDSASFLMGYNTSTWDRLKTTAAGDNQTVGILATGLYGYDGTNMDRVHVDTSGNLKVNIAVGGLSGTTTPTDTFTTPTDASDTAAFLMGYNGTNWDMLRNTTHGDNITTTKGLNVAAVLYGWDGTNYDRAKIDTNGSLYVNPGALSSTTDSVEVKQSTAANLKAEVSGTVTPADNMTTTTAIQTVSIMAGYDGTNYDRVHVDTNGSLAVNAAPLADTIDSIIANTTSNATSNITANTTTPVKATAGKMMKVIVRNDSVGATSTVLFYDIASAGCTGTPASGNTFVLLGTTTVNTIYDLNLQFTNGICAVTAGGTAANITILYR